MTPEERINEYYWWVLSRIKEELLIALKGKPVCYKFSHVIASGVPGRETEESILRKLEESGVLKVRDDPFVPPIPREGEIYLDIIQSKFDEIYEQYNPSKLAVITEHSPIETKVEESLGIVLVDLEAKYEDILQEKNESNFYLKLADYGKYIIDRKEIYSIINPLYKQSQNQVAEYKKASDVFMEKWKVLAQDLVEQAEKAGIIDHPTSPFINQINELRGKMQEMPSYDDDYLNWYFRPYTELVERFKAEGKFELITPKHFFINKDKGVEHMLLGNEYDKAQEEWEKFNRVREIQVWWAHYQIMRLAHGVFNLKDKGEYFHNDNIIDTIYLYEFQQIAQGKKDTMILRRNRFEEWIKRLHQFLISRLKYSLSTNRNRDQVNGTELNRQQYSKSSGSNKLLFYPDDGIAGYRTAQYTFKGKAKVLLEFLHRSKNTPFSLDDIKQKCNPNITNSKHYFKGDKDARDIVNYIRKMLKVNEGEFFPIHKRENNWIWLEK